jgi:ABC-2 type transport system permease protein
MNGHVVNSIIRKDLFEFSRNRFLVFITILVLVVWVVVFWLLPSSVDETVRVGVHHTGLDAVIGGLQSDESVGLQLIAYPTEEDLRTAVEEGQDDVIAGLAFPANFLEVTASGETATVQLLVPAGLSSEQRLLLTGFVSETAHAIAGNEPPVDPATEAIILGTDRVGAQIALQDQMRPLLLVLVLMVETFALAALVAVEVQERTVVAVLATPARVGDFLAAKGIFGTALAFSEVVLLGLLIGAFAVNAPVIVVTLLLGAVLVTGFGLFAGAFGRDFLGTLFIAFFFMIPLMIPAFGALFPGSTAAWIKVLPTYGLVEALVGVAVDGESWAEVTPVLLLLAAWSVAAFAVGALALRRRVATL